VARPRVIVVGPLQMNCYLWPCAPGKCLVVDPGAEPGRIVDELEGLGLTPAAVALTHGHPDHLGAAGELARRYSVPVYLQPDDNLWIELLRSDWVPDFGPRPDYWPEFTAYPDLLDYPELKLQVLPLPGHSPGSVVLYSARDACACVGDVLFAGGIGRTDLPGGDEEQLFRGLRETLFELPPSTEILPGHGPATNLARERAVNPFITW
jgi:glyoxylase-like metal-dependent hydrolase (beta-lactamase superfamily II)